MAEISKPTQNASDEAEDSVSYDIMDYCDNNSYGTLAVFNISVTLLGLITGAFLVVMICKNPALRGDKFLLLNNLLGAAIVLLTITGLIYTEEAINPCWHIGNFLCKLVLFSKTFLTNVSTFFLVALSFQQLNRYRRKMVTVFNSSHKRWLITIIVMWATAILISIPELVTSKVLRYDTEGALSICGIFTVNLAVRVTDSAKILFLEYITPFLILAVTVVITGVYVYLVKSQYTTFGVTTGESLVPRSLKHPHHFMLIVCLTVIYIIGYFPLYSYELAFFIEGVAKRGRFKPIWFYMDLVSIFFALLPPALVPISIMICSWPHRDAVVAIYRNIKVDIFEEQETSGSGLHGEQSVDRK